MMRFLFTLIILPGVIFMMNSFSVDSPPALSGRIYLSVLTVFMFFRSYFYFKFKRSFPKADNDPDRWLRRSISAGIIASIVTMFLNAPCNFEVPAIFVFTGSFFGFISVWLIWQAHSDLSVSWSPGGLSHGSGLVVSGVFKFVRNPIYSAFFFLSFSQLFLAGNFLTAPLLLMMFIPFYLRRIKIEEDHLASTYGEEYLRYKNSTPALFPIFFRGRK